LFVRIHLEDSAQPCGWRIVVNQPNCVGTLGTRPGDGRMPLSGEGCAIIHVHNDNRVLVFQRWVEGIGNDVVVAASLNEKNWYNYQIGFPSGGCWKEVFNSDVYDNWVNPTTAGNGGGLSVSGPPMHGLGFSAAITIPANGFVAFARP
jgi:1,4-alpha-glucan branching enzyme